MTPTLTTLTKLLVVREIQQDAGGATIHFQHGCQGRLDALDANYAAHVRLMQRSQERQHPVGVTFGEGFAIVELLRADNDVPAQVWEEEPNHPRVLFQGHDGVFHLNGDHPEQGRIRALLDEALKQKARVWFIAQKTDLAIRDVVAAAA